MEFQLFYCKNGQEEKRKRHLMIFALRKQNEPPQLFDLDELSFAIIFSKKNVEHEI